MTKRAIAAAAALVLLAQWPVPAAAKMGDAAWGKCIWATAPQAAAEWLTLKLPQWPTPMTEANLRLGYKLAALCDDSAVTPKGRSRAPDWKTMAAALRKAKPKGSLPDAVSGAPNVFLCESRAGKDGQWFPYLYQVVRRGQLGERIAFDQYVAVVEGQSVKLPANLSVVPPAGTRTERTCRLIDDKGGLRDG